MHEDQDKNLSTIDSNLKRKPRVASTNVAADEIVAELLTRQNEIHRWVGRSNLAFDSRYSHLNKQKFQKSLPEIVTGNPESLLAQNVDVAIMASFNSPQLIKQVKAFDIEVVLNTNFNSILDIMNNIELIGKKIHAEPEAAELVAEMKHRLHVLRENPLHMSKGQKPSVIRFAANGVVSGEGTVFDDIVKHAGGENLAATKGLKGWAKINDEIIASLSPDFIISQPSHKNRSEIIDFIRSFPSWRLMKNLELSSLILLPERNLNASSHHVVLVTEQLHKQLLSRIQSAGKP